VKWKLELAVKKLGLGEKHNLNVDEAHDAGFDCRATHYLFEELRQLAAEPAEGFGRMI
jgi:hypothetical protein